MIFLSHNKADKAVAAELAIFLAAENLSVWFDEWEISAGDSIVGRIGDGLQRCSHFVLLWSQHADKSDWVRKEMSSALARAIEAGYPRIIPIRLDDTALPALLADLKYIRHSGEIEKDRAGLVTEILGNAPSRNYLRAVVRKYQELVRDPETGDYRACPECGSARIRYIEHTDPVTLDCRVVVRCLDCDWGDLFA